MKNQPLVRDDLISQDLGSELMLYDPVNDSAHVLNHTAMVIFRLCDGKHSIEEIAREVKGRFEVKDDYDLSRDVENFIEEFREKGLLKGSL